MDWAAQAQLIVAVGPAKARRLRALAIRTVFDLETAVRDPAWHPRLAAILGEDADGPGPVPVVSQVAAIGANLHVQRLRQVWNAILVVVTTAPPVGPWVPAVRKAA